MNPYDPRAPLYQGQALQGQQPQQPQPQAPQLAGQPQAQHAIPVAAPDTSRLHFLNALGNFALAAGHLFAGSGEENEEDEDEAPIRRRPRASSFRAGKGSCCAAKRPSR